MREVVKKCPERFRTLFESLLSLIPLSMFFFPKKRGLAEKSAVSLLFCPFLRFFGPKKAPSPCFRIFYPRFFLSKLCFFEPPNALCTKKQARVDRKRKKHRKRKKAQKGGSGFMVNRQISNFFRLLCCSTSPYNPI